MALRTVEDLLAPLSWEELRRDHYGRRHRHIPGGAAKVDGFASWAALNHALETQRIAHPRLLVARHGQEVEVFNTRLDRRRQPLHELDIAELYRRLRAGYTLLLYEVEELFPEVKAVSDALGRLFGPGCQANLFASWGRDGNGIHQDDHEVFVVQVSGHKRWRLFGPTRAYPLQRDQALGLGTEPPTTVVDDVLLGPGDVLYVPRGHWHDVAGVGEPSLHISFGIENPTGLSLFDWFARQLPDHPLLAQALPRFADAETQGRHMDQLRELFLEQLSDDVIERFFASSEARVRARPRLGLPGAAVGDGLPAGDAFVVASNLPAAPHIHVEGEQVVVAALARSFRFERAHEAVIRRLLGNRPWSFQELLAEAEGVSAASARPVVAELLLNGLVYVVA